MELEQKDSLMEKHMLEVIKKIDRMAKGNIIGRMEIIIKGSFQTDLGMDKVTLSKEKLASSIKGSTKTIKNVDMDK
jgi:hypothetical protein